MRIFTRVLPLALAATLVGVLWNTPGGAAMDGDGYPDSMASLGDSITRAMNPEPSLLEDQPQYSWSTGDNSAVESHYYRILQQNSLISGNNYNDAVSGARMTDLNGQAQTAVSQGVDYVTILMGANDVCRPSEATMTAVVTFRSQFQQAMETLTLGLPDARIFVVSIVDIYNLWLILKDDPSVVFTWNDHDSCESLLANPTSTGQADVDRRDRVRQRNIGFNTQLAEVCALYTNCRFDDNAVFNTQFVASDVSTLDYFHPSIAGQMKLASVSWVATYDFSPTPAPTPTPTPTPTPSPMPGGGSADFTDVDDTASIPADPSGGSSFPYAALAGGVSAAFAIIVAGGYYARRRWWVR